MPASLERAEADLVNRLCKTGLSREAATLTVVMATRAHARPEHELLDIVLQYPGLEERLAAESALKQLRELGWVVNTESYGMTLTHQAPDLRERIGDRLGDDSVAERLVALRADLEPFVNVVGPMKDGRVYSTYLELLGNAQTEICLPMLATSPRISSVSTLRERARAGVQIKVLLGASLVVARLRGETMRVIAEDRIREWQRNFRGLPCAEVRVSHSVEDMWLASCMLIDRRLVRLDIYDPDAQRSLEGVMIEIESPQGMNLNVVRVFGELFDGAWHRAQPLSSAERALWWWRRAWKVWTGIAAAALALIPVPVEPWFELLIGISSGLLATAIIEFSVTTRTRRRQR